MKKLKLTFICLVTLLFIIGCGTPEITGSDDGELPGGAEEDAAGDSVGQNKNEDIESPVLLEIEDDGSDFDKLLASDALFIPNIKANVDEETTGEILTMHLVNQSDDSIKTTIPCGLVFAPDDESEQPLMLVQPLEINLAAGEEIELRPYVVCIDMGTSAPVLGSSYTVGYSADNKLLQFAECICEQEISKELGDMDSVGIQFATWAISTNGDITNFINETDENVLSEMINETSADEFAEYFSEVIDDFGNEWLERCNISFDAE